jgi:hypothetical protein
MNPIARKAGAPADTSLDCKFMDPPGPQSIRQRRVGAGEVRAEMAGCA